MSVLISNGYTIILPPTLLRGRWARSARRGSRLRLQALEILRSYLGCSLKQILLRGRRRFDPLRLRVRFGASPAGAWEELGREVGR